MHSREAGLPDRLAEARFGGHRAFLSSNHTTCFIGSMLFSNHYAKQLPLTESKAKVV